MTHQDKLKRLLEQHLNRPLVEGVDMEIKRATGREGCGKLPEEIWETYSAFANTQGGIILLGIEELPNSEFEIVGIPDPEPVVQEFWQALNNPKKVSVNLLTEHDIELFQTQLGAVLIISVPKAPPDQFPIFINNDPKRGTYKRVGESDMVM